MSLLTNGGVGIECPNGHVYTYLKELPDYWPEGAPSCPICCKTWIYTHPTWSYVKKLKEMAKIKKRLLEDYERTKRKKQ